MDKKNCKHDPQKILFEKSLKHRLAPLINYHRLFFIYELQPYSSTYRIGSPPPLKVDKTALKYGFTKQKLQRCNTNSTNILE